MDFRKKSPEFFRSIHVYSKKKRIMFGVSDNVIQTN